MKKKIIALVISIISIFVLIIGVSLAHFTSADSITNVFNTGDIKAEPYEPDFKPPNDWTGINYDKKVQVKNTGNSACFVRVSITPRWVDENGNAWAGDVSNSVVNLEFSNLIDLSNNSTWEENKWVKGSDGFYYYTSILPVGEITSQLLDKVGATINSTTVDYPEDYSGKILKVDVKVEAVQTTANAYLTTWNNIPDNIKPLFMKLTSTQN